MTTQVDKSQYHVFLGGADLEMKKIRELLDKEGVSYSDGKLGWGAKTSDYGEAINQVAQEGKTPVIIELSVDSELPKNTVNIDHHNENSSKKASILQICDLLKINPTREALLVAANDSGYIPAMIEMGATKEEINKIRYQDRAAQGITSEQEQQAEEALKNKVEVAGVTVVKMPHSKTSTVTDRLFDSSKPQNIAIFSGDGEINYFGPEDVCRKLKDSFQGWIGGSGIGTDGGTGYWGGYPKHTDALALILNENKKKQNDAKQIDPKILDRIQEGMNR